MRALEDFAEPMGKRHLRLVSGLIQNSKNFWDLFGTHVEVKILGRPDDAGYALEHAGAADEKRNLRVVQSVEYAAIKIVCFGLIGQAFHKIASLQGAGTSKILKGGRSGKL